MKTVDIRKLNTSDLTTEVNKLRADIAEMRRKIHMGETTNVRILRAQRKDLARMLTVLSEQLAKENI
ncbi:50S ribosomal protein L29 [Candidatus Saccharibacteria bacterium]|jgi:ribosomal protein L29|nr:50S ribosomal protein L29 [Candidatus Saccharibacteria bacterium]